VQSQCAFPFKRLLIDHYIRGATQVTWELDSSFHDPEPHTYQLQAGRTASNDSNDWVDVGTSAEDVTTLADDEQRLHGKRLITHYRIKLMTPVTTYFSDPEPVYGLLSKRDWRLAREVVRKERLRHRYASQEGILLKRRRFGARCDACRDTLTEEVTDSDCPECYGTGFEVGYHVPVPFQLWDLQPETIKEDRDANRMRGSTRDTALRARVLGCIQLNKHDAWVHASNDQRWIVHTIQHAAEMRGVPLVMQVELRLAPYTHAVYDVEVGGEPAALPGPVLPAPEESTAGEDAVLVDHDYGGADNLAYVDADGNAIVGATIKAFLKEDHLAGRTSEAYTQDSTTTTANGRWLRSFLLNPGEYRLVYEKKGVVGPDVVDITVPLATSSSSSSNSSSSSSSNSSSSFWSV